MRPARALHLAAIVSFVLAVVALILGKSVAATALFFVAAAAFLATIVLQGRR